MTGNTFVFSLADIDILTIYDGITKQIWLWSVDLEMLHGLCVAQGNLRSLTIPCPCENTSKINGSLVYDLTGRLPLFGPWPVSPWCCLQHETNPTHPSLTSFRMAMFGVFKSHPWSIFYRSKHHPIMYPVIQPCWFVQKNQQQQVTSWCTQPYAWRHWSWHWQWKSHAISGSFSGVCDSDGTRDPGT